MNIMHLQLFHFSSKISQYAAYHRFETVRHSSTSTTPHQLSGLQKQVLALYRKLLRASNQKDPEPLIYSLKDSDSVTFAVKTKFREKAMQLNKRDVVRIEYNIRQGEKYVKTLQMNGVRGMKSTT